MKVLLCAPIDGNVGGISNWSKHIISYYNDLQDPEFKLMTYSTARSKHFQTDATLFHRIKNGIGDYVSILKGYSKVIKVNDFNIIHITSSASLGLIANIFMLFIAKKQGIKTIIHFHFGRIPEVYKKNNWEQRLIHKAIKLSNKTIVIDKLSYHTLIEKCYTNIVLLPNPLSPNVQSIIAENSAIKRIERKILFAGHVVQSKGVLELVEACKNIENIQVEIIGNISPVMRNRLTQLISKNQSRFCITGEKDYNSTIKSMLSADIFVLPTYTEGFPNVIIESMACGCSIIASAVGAIPEMLDIGADEECGICIQPKNIIQLKEAIEIMLSDKIFANNCRSNAKRKVNKFYTISIIWDDLVSLWRSVLN